MKVDTRGNVCHVSFDSLSDCFEHVEKSPYNSRLNNQIGDDPKWYGRGIRSVADGVRLAKAGDGAAGVDAIESAIQAVQERDTDDLPTLLGAVTHDVSGSLVDVDAYLQGEPECMMDFPLEETPSFGKIATIVVDGTMSAAVSPSAIVKRGREVMRVLMALDMSGFETELYWAYSVQGYGGEHRWMTSVRLKSAGEVFDTGALMWAVSSPSMLRVLGFSTHGYVPRHIQDGIPSYWPMDTPESQADQFPDGHVIIPGMKTDRDAEQDLVKFTLDKIMPRD